MALAPNDTVPLDRRFERATTSDTAEDWAEALADKPRNWEWLSGRSRVVALLAQAGSGKTVEFMRQVDEVRSANRDAFFFRVERLCSEPLEGAHETPDCRARFEEWVKPTVQRSSSSTPSMRRNFHRRGQPAHCGMRSVR